MVSPASTSARHATPGGAAIATVNLAEALSTLAGRGGDPITVVSTLTSRGLLDGAIMVEAFTAADAVETARLRPLTRAAGLSLADRVCLALARRLGVAALTADHAWSSLALDVEVRAIRPYPRR